MSSISEPGSDRVVLVTFGSATNRPISPKLSYQTEEHGTFQAYLTTEAGIRYVQMCEANDQLWLYCFASESFKSGTYTPAGSDKKRSIVDDIKALQRKTPADRFTFVSVADSLSRDNQLTQLQEMQKRLKLSKNDKIYIDMTGGKRDAAMMMISLVRFLQFQDIQPEMILYSDMNSGAENIGRIVNTTHLATVFNLFSAMDIFLKTGAAGNLRQSIMEAADKGWVIPKPLDDVLLALEAFSDKIALCQAARFQEAIAQIRRALDAYHPQDCIYPESLFAMLVERVRSEFASITGAPENLIATERWLLNHGLVQQALTLYTDHMPDMIYGSERCIFAQEKEEGDKHYSAAYNHLVYDVCASAAKLCDSRCRGYKFEKTDKIRFLKSPYITPDATFSEQKIKKLETFFNIVYDEAAPLCHKSENKPKTVDENVKAEVSKQTGIELLKEEIAALSKEAKDEFRQMNMNGLSVHTGLLCRILGIPANPRKSRGNSKGITLDKALDLVLQDTFAFADYRPDDWRELAFVRDRKKCALALVDYALMKTLRNNTNHASRKNALKRRDAERLRAFAPDHYILRDGMEDDLKPKDVAQAMEHALDNLEACLKAPLLK